LKLQQGLSDECRETAADVSLSWRVHLLAERPVRSVAAIALVGAFCVLVLLTYEPVFVVLSIGFFLVSLAPFFFPTTYELTPEGPSRRILGLRTARRWSEFRSYGWGRDGVRLNTAPRRSRLGNLRGFSLPFAGNRDEVLAYVARHVPGAVRGPAPQAAGSAAPSRGHVASPGRP